uniref:Uncharacterized protein n=1 Tax=Nelumbo nucifera TaxID=4432 RepID=A0A822ZBF4_NELNU|nr:TPA_asm: hypothetical protein HUJ06_000467 [Nelumbo nucifera]
MASLLPSIFRCFVAPSSRVSDKIEGVDYEQSKSKNLQEKPKSKEKKAGAPIPVSYFPINSNLSRL